MYLHLGNNILIQKTELVAVFDLDNSSQSYLTREYLSRAEQSGAVINASGTELPKSFVLCAGNGGIQRVYLSQLNASTLLRRGETRGIG